MFSPILAEAAGGAAIITAIGGVFVSLATVYLNSKKQTSATNDNKSQIEALIDQITDLQARLDDCERKTKRKAPTKRKA